MQKKHFLLLSAATVILFSSCSKLGPLSADNFNVAPNPLETQAGIVPASINGHFPEKYMKRKAIVTVVPELRYSNGTVVQGNTATFQGEKVAGNEQVISYRLGGNYTMKTNFPYADDNKADMYLTFRAFIGSKKVNVPEVKVAYGIIAICRGETANGFAMIGAGLLLAGLSILLFFASKAATKGAFKLTQKTVLWIKTLIVGKEKNK